MPSVREWAASNALQAQRAAGDDAALKPLYEEENDRLRQELEQLRGEYDQWLSFQPG